MDEKSTGVKLLDAVCEFGELHPLIKAQRFAKWSPVAYAGVAVDHRKREQAKKLTSGIDIHWGKEIRYHRAHR